MNKKWFELQNANYAIMSEAEQKEFLKGYKKVFNKASAMGSILKIVTVNESCKIPAYLDHKYAEHKKNGDKNRYRIFLSVENESTERIQMTSNLFREYLNVGITEIKNVIYKYNGNYICDGSIKEICLEEWKDEIAPLPQITSWHSVICVETEFIPLSHDGNLKRVKELSARKKHKENAAKYKDAVISGDLTFFRVRQTIKVKNDVYDGYNAVLKQLEDYYPNITRFGKFKGDSYISCNRCVKFNPFSLVELQDETGFCYGANPTSAKPIFYNRNDNYLPHMLICGISGSGVLNVAVNEMIQVYESTNDNIIVIEDDENLIHSLRDRGCACYALSENVFTNKPEAYHINPLDVVFRPHDTHYMWKKGVNTTIAIINGFIQRELTESEENAVKLSYAEVFEPFVNELESEYEAKAIKYQDYSIGYEINIEHNPTVIDVVEVLENKHNEECKELLELIGKNGTLRKYLELLSFKTKMPNGRFGRFISLHLMYIPDKISKAFYAAAMSYAYNQMLMHGDYTKHWIYFNNISFYSKNSNAFSSLFRDLRVQSRRYQGILTFTEMSFADVYRSSLAEEIISHVSFYCFLSQSILDRMYIKEQFNLSESLFDFIKDRPCGEGILIDEAFKMKGRKIVPVSMKRNNGPITQFEKEQLIEMRRNKYTKFHKKERMVL